MSWAARFTPQGIVVTPTVLSDGESRQYNAAILTMPALAERAGIRDFTWEITGHVHDPEAAASAPSFLRITVLEEA